MLLLGDKAQVEARSVHLKQDRCTVCSECTIGLEIIFDAPDGTHR
jgi:hypothetical protein